MLHNDITDSHVINFFMLVLEFGQWIERTFPE